MRQRNRYQSDPRTCQLIAQTAARLLAEEGGHDVSAAKKKAARQMGITDRQQLPDNETVQEALEQYLRLFRSQQQPEALQRLRLTALEAMRLLGDFAPCLVGPVLNGTADAHTPVYLHLFADTAEEVMIALMERQIPFEQGERHIQYASGRSEYLPKFRFIAGESEIQLTVFPLKGRRQAPLSPIDGRPQQRADQRELERLLQAAQDISG